MDDNSHHATVSPEQAGMRLDKWLTGVFPAFSRSRLQSLIDTGHVFCGEKRASDASVKVKAGQGYRLEIPEVAPSYLAPQPIALDIVYEDGDLLIVNKQAGLTVHPGAGNPDGTLVNALLAHCGDSLSGVGGVARPGIVHRLDKDTSGLLVVAKNDASHAHLSRQLAARTLGRTYMAVCWGAPKQKVGTITGNIARSPVNRQKMAVVRTGGKPAVTHYKVVGSWQPAVGSLVECKLETGRTHQIRVHMAHIGCPLVGDPVYGQPTAQRLRSAACRGLPDAARAALLGFTRQALHAKALTLIHPRLSKTMSFTSDLPDDMRRLIEAIG